MEIIPRLIITPGEPAGVGPDVVLQMAAESWPAELIVVGSPALLKARAQELNLSVELETIDFSQPAEKSARGRLKIFPVELAAPCETGKLNSQNSPYVIRCLEIAAEFCLKKTAAALVTGPVNKSIINRANIPFSGHTEFFAEYCRVKKTIMLFVIDHLKVALATTHIPLSQVAAAITKPDLENVVRLLQIELQNTFHLPQPKILICGLNPHAGENGILGREEIDVITPVINKLRAENFDLTGPLPADTVFTEKYLQSADAILAMYHDQALPVIKYMGFDRAVNVTLGLPFIRTSVDHGTALEIAGTARSDAGSLRAAIHLAIDLIKPADKT